VRYNVLPFDWSSLWVKLLLPVLTYKGPVLLAAGLAFYWLRGDTASRPYRYFAPVALVLLVTMGRKGSDVNYLLIPVAALAALAGRGMALAPGSVKRGVLGALACAQLALCLLLETPRVGSDELTAIAARDRLVLQQVREVAGESGTVLFEEPSLALLAGREVEYEPFMCTQLAALGLWDPGPIVSRIQSRAYAAIQRTALVRVKGDTATDIFWIGDRTIPALRQAVEAAYAPIRAGLKGKPHAPGLLEAYLVWVRQGS
jgi:hypothetical protein